MSDERRTRRDFIRTSAIAGGDLAGRGLRPPAGSRRGQRRDRVGLIGCGGRGRGAAADAVKSSPGVRVVAIGDAFADRVAEARERLKELGEAGAVPEASVRSSGLDAYQKVIADAGRQLRDPRDAARIPSDAPRGRGRGRQERLHREAGGGRRPRHPLRARDATRRPRQKASASAPARSAGTSRATSRRSRRVHDGGIGEIVAARAYWNQGSLWNKPRQASWSDLEWQMRNWLYFTWLSGDHIVEQHVHNLDVVNWALGGHPRARDGHGRAPVAHQPRLRPRLRPLRDRLRVRGRRARDVDVPPDPRLRQPRGRDDRGHEGRLRARERREALRARRAASAYKFTGSATNPYVQEHTDLIASIRAGKPYNELKQVAESTLTAIMGRISAYTGKAVTWEEALASSEALVPTNLAFGPMPVPPVARPGQVT